MKRSKSTSSIRGSAKQERIEKRLQGTQADARGVRYELRVVNYFSSKGWKPQTRLRAFGYEYDIFAQRWDFFHGSRYLVVECKNVETVTVRDVAHFIAKVDALYHGLPELENSTAQLYAYLCHSRQVSKETEIVARRHTPPIELVKIR